MADCAAEAEFVAFDLQISPSQICRDYAKPQGNIVHVHYAKKTVKVKHWDFDRFRPSVQLSC
jgi:hypothetical protein